MIGFPDVDWVDGCESTERGKVRWVVGKLGWFEKWVDA